MSKTKETASTDKSALNDLLCVHLSKDLQRCTNKPTAKVVGGGSNIWNNYGCCEDHYKFAWENGLKLKEIKNT